MDGPSAQFRWHDILIDHIREYTNGIFRSEAPDAAVFPSFHGHFGRFCNSPDAFLLSACLEIGFNRRRQHRAAERWRAIRTTDFERRQMAALRQELDHEYEARNGFAAKPSADEDRAKLYSTSRT